MSNEKIAQDSNPLLFATINCKTKEKQLCRTIERIWDKPVFFIRPSVRETISHVVDMSLLSETVSPDLILIDMESGEKDACAIIDTIHIRVTARSSHCPAGRRQQ